MTEEDIKKLKFKECTHATFDTEYHSFYECISEPLKGRLYVDSVIRRDKYTGASIGKGSVGYFLDGKFYETKEKLLEAIKDIEYGK